MITLFLAKHFQWTEKTFGSGLRTKGITNHIRKELEEIEAEPYKLEEWIDVLLLAFDGARRTGATPTQILQALEDKHYKVKERTYPFPTSEDEVSEHVREGEFVSTPNSERSWIKEEFEKAFNITEPTDDLSCSERAYDWFKFSSNVFEHIENYTVNQYGDKGQDQITEWTVEECFKSVSKRIARFGRQSREGQQELDFLKMAHEVQIAATKYEESKGEN